MLEELERVVVLRLVFDDDELELETLRVELLLTLRDELELLLPELRLVLELDTLRLELELVLLGRSYVEPAWAERLDVAGVTLLTACELLDCDTLRVELLPDTLRLEDEPDTLRLELLLLTLRLELLLPVLRLDEEAATLRLELLLLTLRFADEPDTPRLSPEFTALEATAPPGRLTLRLLLEPEIPLLTAVERLRFLSQPPPLMLRLPT